MRTIAEISLTIAILYFASMVLYVLFRPLFRRYLESRRRGQEQHRSAVNYIIVPDTQAETHAIIDSTQSTMIHVFRSSLEVVIKRGITQDQELGEDRVRMPLELHTSSEIREALRDTDVTYLMQS